jgi:hypothetical protein
MSRRQVELVKCDACFAELPTPAPSDWTQWRHPRDAKTWDVCGSCTSAVAGFLFSEPRTRVIVDGAGHPAERAAYEASRSRA